MAGAIAATKLPSRGEANGSKELTIYISYDELRLGVFRTLLNDVEAIYNVIDRHVVAVQPFADRTPLTVRQADTGRSITLVAIGAPSALQLFGLLLGAVHSVWGQTTLGIGTLYGGARGLVELRNKWIEGEKTKAETRKINAETQKAIAEASKANADASKRDSEVDKTKAEAAKGWLEAAKLYRELESDGLSPQEPESLVHRLQSRLRIIGNLSEIKAVELKAGGKILSLRHGEEGPKLLDQE